MAATLRETVARRRATYEDVLELSVQLDVSCGPSSIPHLMMGTDAAPQRPHTPATQATSGIRPADRVAAT